MHRALADGDTKTIGRAAHRIKGSLSYFGAETALSRALRLEEMAVHGELAEAPVTIALLEAELSRLRPLLQTSPKTTESVAGN